MLRAEPPWALASGSPSPRGQPCKLWRASGGGRLPAASSKAAGRTRGSRQRRAPLLRPARGSRPAGRRRLPSCLRPGAGMLPPLPTSGKPKGWQFPRVSDRRDSKSGGGDARTRLVHARWSSRPGSRRREGPLPPLSPGAWARSPPPIGRCCPLAAAGKRAPGAAPPPGPRRALGPPLAAGRTAAAGP